MFRYGAIVVAAALTAGLSSCAREEQRSDSNYYERKIGPILTGACIVSATGSSCHVTADDFGNALGNLDVTNYEMVNKRRDALINYGPYGMPNLLLKAVPPYTLTLTAWDGAPTPVMTDITHAGGSLIDVPSSVFSTLQRWLANGALENNSPPATPTHVAKPCSPKPGADPAFDRTLDPASPHYAQFASNVNPVLVKSCGAGNCHGAAGASLYITCGETPEQTRWNYFAARDYVTGDPDRSELLRRTLDPAQGGVYHEGGVVFPTTSHAGYQALRTWIEAEGGPDNVPTGQGFEIFAKRVQPLLARRGCMVVGCHSPIGFNDYMLRGGSGGYFSLPVTRGNYRATLKNASVESPDPNASRIVRKNLPLHPAGTGIRHRGGALMGDGGDPSQCDPVAALNEPLSELTQSMYCVIAAWLAKEREERSGSYAPLSGIVYVRRPPTQSPETPQTFEAYHPGADLRLAGASIDDQGTLSVTGSDASLMSGCGLDPATADVRRPAVSWDGKKIAFGARSSGSEPLRIYSMNADGSGCSVEPTIDLPPVDDKGEPVPTNGELVHNFDPTFAPDGRMVFVSTRGNTKPTVMDSFFKGPQRTPADPSQLNTNLYVLEQGKIRQLTFMLNHDLSPSFKANGQLVFVKEKRVPGFYQLAGRRMNLDGGDYHPLFGQRPTIGANQVTDIVELSDHNFAAIFSDRGALHGGGTLAIVNRSLGPDTVSQDPSQYPLDPEAINKISPVFFQHMVSFPDPSAKPGPETQGAYRNPSALPNAQLLVSYAANVVDLTSFSGNFDVVMIDPMSGQRTPLPGLSEPGQDELWPVAVYGRVSHGVFETTLFTGVQGAGVVYAEDDDQPRVDRMDLTFLDVNVLVPLVFQNTRAGRPVLGLKEFEIWIDLPPEPGVTSLDQQSAFIVDDQFGRVYARRSYFGTVPLLADDSARVQAPGGVPVYLAARVQLPGESAPNLHFTREEIQFYPGEWTRFSHRREVFNGFCGGCHGSISGKEFDVAATPDIMSGASKALAVTADPFSLMKAAPAAPVGPPFL